jgi:hypothetical protein
VIGPTKGVVPQRALLAVGAQVLRVLDQPMTISQVWTQVRNWRKEHRHHAPLPFWWFVLALDLLYALDLIEPDHDLLTRRPVDATRVGSK